MNREPSTWNTIIALAQLFAVFVIAATAGLTALALAIWVPIAAVRGMWRLGKRGLHWDRTASLDQFEPQELELSAAHVMVERLAPYTALAWRNIRAN